MPRYYQLVASGRQLALFVFAVAGLLALAFFLGVGVGLSERQERAETAPVAPTPVAFSPLATPTSQPPTPPPPTPTAAMPPPSEGLVEVEPTATPVPSPTLRPTAKPSAEVPHGVWVQVAALSSKADAEGVRHRVVALGFRQDQVRVLPLASGKYRVRVGPFPDKESGSRVVARLRREGFPQAYVVSE